jgi:hypothetical protein
MNSTHQQSFTRALSLSVLLLSPAVLAQEKTFELLELESGISALYSYGIKTVGLGGVSEAKLNLHPRFAAALRVDGGIQGGGNISAAITAFALAINVATLVKGEFYLTESGVRPYVGLGAGVYWLTLQSVGAGGGGIPSVYQGIGRHFGLAPQIGIDFGNVRLAATYNAILGADLIVQQSVGGAPVNERNSRNFIALELTFRNFGWTPAVKEAPADEGS